MSTREDFWRKLINNMSEPMPEVGKEPPEQENIKPKTRIKRVTQDKDRRVNVQKIITEIYVFTDTRDKVYTSHVSQSTLILGEMTLEEGMKLARGEKKDNGTT